MARIACGGRLSAHHLTPSAVLCKGEDAPVRLWQLPVSMQYPGCPSTPPLPQVCKDNDALVRLRPLPVSMQYPGCPSTPPLPQ
eukprot:362800-Chlamydomonas_euryale.AAC.3